MPVVSSNKDCTLSQTLHLPAFLVKPSKIPNFANPIGPVVEWILRKSPELKIQVRFLTGPPPNLHTTPALITFFLSRHGKYLTGLQPDGSFFQSESEQHVWV